MLSSFKVLRLNERVMVWLRLYSHQLTPASIPSDDFFQSISMYCISLNMFAFQVASAAFVYSNTSVVVDALRTGMVTVGVGQALGMFLCVGCNIGTVKLLHQKLQAIIDQAAKGTFTSIKCRWFRWKWTFHSFADGHGHIVNMYWEIEEKCCQYTKLMLYYIYCHQMPVNAALTYAIYCIYTGDVNTSAWILPFNVAVPFDTQFVRGWLYKWFFEFTAGFAYILCMIIPTTYFFSFCLYIVGICSHFDMLVNEIRCDVEYIESDPNESNEYSKMWNCVRQKFVQLIDIHVNLLE